MAEKKWYIKRLEENRVKLTERINLQDGLYSELRKRKVITQKQEESWKYKGSNAEQVECLLDHLGKIRSQLVFKEFSASLESNSKQGRDIVKELLTSPNKDEWITTFDRQDEGAPNYWPEAESPIKDCWHILLMQRNRVALTESINLQVGLYSELRQRELITKTEEDEWKHIGANAKQVEALLDHMLPRSQEDFSSLCKSLESNNQRNVVDEYLTHFSGLKDELPKNSKPTDPITVKKMILIDGIKTYYKTDNFRGVAMSFQDKDELDFVDHIYCSMEWEDAVFEPLNDYMGLLNKMKAKEKGSLGLVRALIKGVSGVGKTTLMKKMAHDYAENGEIAQLFPVVIYLELRDITDGVTFAGSVLDQLCLSDTKLSEQDVVDIVYKEQDDILLLLDGYDEYSHSRSEEITKILLHEMLMKTASVTTSRPWKTGELKRNYKGAQLKGFSDISIIKFMIRYFCCQKNISRVSAEKIEKKVNMVHSKASRAMNELLNSLDLHELLMSKLKYVTKSDIKKCLEDVISDKLVSGEENLTDEEVTVLKSIQELVHCVDELDFWDEVQVPFMCLFLCIIGFEDSEDDEEKTSIGHSEKLPVSCTQLYSLIPEKLIQRRHMKITKQDSYDPVVQQYKTDHKDDLNGVACLAYEGVSSSEGGRMGFPISEAKKYIKNDEIYELGILNKSKIKRRGEQVMFTHKSLQEYFAAKHIIDKAKECPDNTVVKSMLKKVAPFILSMDRFAEFCISLEPNMSMELKNLLFSVCLDYQLESLSKVIYFDCMGLDLFVSRFCMRIRELCSLERSIDTSLLKENPQLSGYLPTLFVYEGSAEGKKKKVPTATLR